MDPAWALLATFLFIHWLEGAFWVRRSAVVFVERRTRWDRVGTTSPLGNAHSVFIFGSPLPPLRGLAVVETWPVLFGAERIYGLPAETVSVIESELDAERILDRARARRAKAFGKSLMVEGRVLAETSSPAFADDLLGLIKAWADEDDPHARLCLVAGFRESRDEAWIRGRLERYCEVTRYLRWLANLVPCVLFGAIFGVFFLHQVFALWPFVLGACLSLLFVCWALFFLGHRKLHPRLTHDRWYKLALLVFAPLATGRAHAWLSRDLFSGAHPVEVAAVLADEKGLRELAGAFLRDLTHPQDLDVYRAVPREILAEARRALLARVERAAKRRGVSIEDLRRPPPDAGPHRYYCPRCLEIYVDGGECSECRGVTRLECGQQIRAALGDA